MRFVAFFARHPHLHFVGSLTIGFDINEIESRGPDITISFFR